MSATATADEKAAPITGGAELVQALRKSGTPDHRLGTAREVLRAAWAEKPPRRAGAEEVYAALDADPATAPGTLAKARSLIDTGRTPAKVKQDDTRIEDVIAPPAPAAEKAAPPKK